MAGHLFIVRGDLTRLACDAWLMPTGFDVHVEPYWYPPDPREFLQGIRQLRSCLPGGWVTGEQRVLRVPVWPGDRSRPWLVNVLGQPFNEMHRVVRQFITAVQAENEPPRRDRERLLLALPVIRTGKGGGAKVKGQVIAALVRSLLQLVQDYEVDLVLVTHTAAALAAAQKARKSRLTGWPGLSLEMLARAQDLAEVGRSQGLALFLGAGVSVSAGLPSWNDLLRDLANEIGITDSELAEFANLDVYDRGSILDRRFKAAGRDLRLAIAQKFERTWDHSLLHGYLACLPAAEAITQNYDRLFEVAAAGAGHSVAVLPYTPGQAYNRWLLKMHGCVSRPDDIVIQREDYLRYTERRAALTGIVQATLLTRCMLFVGFSLRDGNFHRAVDDVRRALRGQAPSSWGTALFLTPSPLTAELWQSELDIVDFQDSGDPAGSIAPAARRLEIFMDCLLAHCGSNTDHLLDPTFAHLLSRGEHDLKAALLELGATLPPRARQAEAWGKVEELLRAMGWSQA
jgi:hypothetical protein